MKEASLKDLVQNFSNFPHPILPNLKMKSEKIPIPALIKKSNLPKSKVKRGRKPFSSLIPKVRPKPKEPTTTDSESLQNPYTLKHMVPNDLQKLLVDSNPHRGVKFTLSQRGNTQMSVDDFLLKKKKGPYEVKGMRVINWKCVKETCLFSLVTKEGMIGQGACKFNGKSKFRQDHNHSPDSSLFIRKQTRVKLRESLEKLDGA